ncbi:MAG: DUF1549 domain-containing protein [Planctomycetota bacterium]
MRGWLIAAVPLGLALMAVGRDAPRTNPLPPEARESEALSARIDAHFAQRWEAAGVTPSPRVDALGFTRRLWLDLLGTVPSLEEVRALEALPEAERRGWAIERALTDPRFASHLAERLARIVVGEDRREDDLLYRRRRLVDWLGLQLVKNRPWDAVVRELIQAEGLSTDTPATNFVVSQERDPLRLAARSTRAFLGVRIDCAQCHDHPFTDWTQDQFQGLAAFWAQVQPTPPLVRDLPAGELYVDEHGVPLPPGQEPASAEEARVVVASVPYGSGYLPEGKGRRQAYAAWLTHPQNPYFAKAIVNRLWSWLLGRGFVEPVDELDLTAPHPLDAPLLDALVEDFVAHGYSLKRLVRAIVSAEVYRVGSALPEGGDEATQAAVWATYPLKQLRPRALGASLLQATSFWTHDRDRAQLLRLARWGQLNDFLQAHGEGKDTEAVEEENLLQRLNLLNGRPFHEATKTDSPFTVVTRIPALAAGADEALEALFLMTLTRRPSEAERALFRPELEAAGSNREQAQVLADAAWVLVNTTEFAWNH